MSDNNWSLPQEKFEPLTTQPIALDALGTELSICFQDLEGPCEIKTCYGDICKIVNALRDYSKMLRMVCEEWNLQGFQQAVFEIHADKLEEISKKYQAGIGYDYDRAVEKCRKKWSKRQREDDTGGEAMAMAYLKAQHAAAKGTRGNSAPSHAKLSGKEPEAVSLNAEQVEHYDIFEDDVIVFWVDISGVSPAMQTIANQIDGDSYDPNCFGVCVNYDFKQRRFYIVIDTQTSVSNPGNVYYINSTGDKHWFSAKLTQTFIEQAFLVCVQSVAHESLKVKPTEQEAYESAALGVAECCCTAADGEGETAV